MKQDNKKFIKQVIVLSIPVMLQQLLNNLLNMTDTLMISSISETALSGVAVANKVFFIYQLILFGLTNGVGIFLSQYSGSNDSDKIKNIFNEGIRLSSYIAIMAVIICLFFKVPIINLYVKNPQTIKIAILYLSAITVSFIPFAFTNMYAVAFRIMGYPKYPMISGAISCITNMILNALLIFGLLGFPRLGVLGAAIATVISRIIEMIFLIALSHKYLKDIKLSWNVNLSFDTKKTIVSKAFPLMCNELIWSIGMNIIFINYSYVNEVMIPSITVVDTISNLIYVAFSGCSVAISVIVGQALGRGDSKESIRMTVKKMLMLSLSIYIGGGIILILTKDYMPLLFSLESYNIMMASKLLLIKGMLSWTLGYSNTIYYVLRAGGDTKSVLIIDGMFTWFGPVLFSFIGARILHLDLAMTYLMAEGSMILKVIIARYFLKKEKWMTNLTLS